MSIHDDEEEFEEAYQYLRQYNIWEDKGPKLVKYLQSIVQYDNTIKLTDSIEIDFVEMVFVTGGWSVHEGLIDALQRNFHFWSLCWYSTERGGKYVFRIPRSVWTQEVSS